MKPHGRDCPDRCSQCLGATARPVTIGANGLAVDGELSGRAVDPTGGRNSYYARRGGRARGSKVPR